MKENPWAYNIPPAEYNKFLIDAVDIIIDRIAEKHTFDGMMKQLETSVIDLCSEGVQYDSPHFDGNFKGFLESNFNSFFRSNTLGCFPPIIGWRMGFGYLKFNITEKKGLELLAKNINFWRNNLAQGYVEGYAFDYTCPLLYDLGSETFMNYH